MRTLPAVLFALIVAVSLDAAPPTQCFHEIPVIEVPPQQIAGFKWSKVIRPMDDPCLGHIEVEPTNGLAWYVGSHTAFYMTKDGGKTWTKPLTGQVRALHLAHDGSIQLVYVAIKDQLFLSRDHGKNWTKIRTFPKLISSLLVFKQTLYVGFQDDSHTQPSGVWVGNLGAGLGQFKPFGAGHTGVITWTLSGDPKSGAVFAGGEIFDKLPKPYKPKVFRTLDKGDQWTYITGTLNWHPIDSAVRPDGFIYLLLEGAGLYGSGDQGNSWQLLKVNFESIGNTLHMDPNNPLRLFAGRHQYKEQIGRVFFSKDGGKTFTPIGLEGATTADIALNGTSSRVYVVLYGSGLYVSGVP